jgi:hypothetical protein
MTAEPGNLTPRPADGGLREITHPLPPGEEAEIYRLLLATRPAIEARRATIIAPIPGVADGYLVRFEGERTPRRRLVHHGWSGNHQLFSALIQRWRLTQNPELLGDFPDSVELAARSRMR